MRNLAIGFVLGVALTLAGVFVITFFFTGPALLLEASAPASAALEGSVVITIEATNPHDEPVILDNVDVPNEFFQNLDIVATRPRASAASPVGGFGTQTWYFEISVPPQETRTVELDVVAKHAGAHIATFQVCNSYEDCSWMVVPIEFSK